MRRTGNCRLLCQVWHFLPPIGRRLIIPTADLAANMIGRSNARRGARRIFAVLQNRRLNQHIVYTIVDEVRLFAPTLTQLAGTTSQVFAALFPETQQS